MRKKSPEPPAKKAATTSAGTDTVLSKYWPLILLFSGMAFVILVRLRLAGLPLERDEGEYAYMGQCLLDGIFPYVEAYNMKLPGVYYLYALMMAIFGQTPAGIHTGLLLFNLGTMYLLFLTGKRLADEKTGTVAAVTYGFLTIVPWTYGFAAHATHFIAFFGTAGFFALLKSEDRHRVQWIIAAGLLFGLAFLMKQQAVFLMIFGGLLLLVRTYRSSGIVPSLLRSVLPYSLAAVFPYLVVVLTALMTGSFDKFWHWTVGYASQYTGINDLGKGLKMLGDTLVAITYGAWFFWLAGIAGAFVLYFSTLKKENRWALSLFCLFSFLCLVPGLYFRNHYFIAFFPALSLLCAVFLRHIFTGKTYLQGLVLLAFAAGTIVTYRSFYFTDMMADICTRVYGKNPFQESQQVAEFIRKNTREDERIAVLGSEPEIYFYSRRKAATGYLYTYPLMETQPYHKAMQEEFISEIEQNKPKYLVLINCSISWLAGPNSDDRILKWYADYVPANYHPVGLADMVAPGNVHYVWKADLASYQKKGTDDITVMERN